MKAFRSTIKSMTLSLLSVLLFSFTSQASSGENGTETITFKKEVSELLASNVLAENGIAESKVSVTFTVEADSSIRILKLHSLDTPIKEYVASVLDGKKSYSDLESGRVYQVTIQFKRI